MNSTKSIKTEKENTKQSEKKQKSSIVNRRLKFSEASEN